MKEFIKTRKISKKISLILMSILLFLLGIMITNESKAVYVNELWDQSTINGKPYDIYCIEPTNPLSNDSSNYRVTTTWTVNGNSVKKNNVAVNSNTSEYKLALKRAYILSTSDTLFTRNQMDTVLKSWKNPYPSTAKRALFNGIYDVTSVKQVAVWKLSGFNKWKNFGSYLKYEWDVGGTVVNFVIRRSKIGSQWHYTYTTDNGGYSEGAFEGVGGNYGMTALNFKSEIDYYTRAENLYNAAISYKGEPTVSLKTEGMSSIQPDYTSDSSYVKIGPYVLEHNSRVTIQTTVDSATDLEGRNIKDKIILSTETIKDKLGNITGTKITIKISKNNMPTSIGKIKIKYTAKNVVTNATIYEVKNTIDGGQNLLSGGGTLQNIDRTIEIPSELTLIPPIKLNLTKKSSLGSNLSGVKFKIEAKQNGSVIAEKNGITSFTTVSGGKTLNWQPTSRDYPIIITITETDVPTGYKVAEPIVITLTYDTTTNKWKATKTTDKENILTITKDTNIDITITNQYISPIKIGGDIKGFKKVDQAGNPVIGADFEAVFEQDGDKFATKTATSDEEGKLDFEAVQPETTSNVKVTIKETNAPAGYENSNYNKTIEFKYNTTNHTWEPLSNDVHASVKYQNKTTHVGLDNVVNQSQIDKLTLIKRDSQDSSKLAGAKFRITLSNIEKIKNYHITSDPANIDVTIGSTGELALEELVIKDVRNPVIITLEETLAPKGYKKIDGTITVKITRVGTEYTITTESSEGVTSSEFVADSVTITGNKGDIDGDGDIDVNDACMALKIAVELDDDGIRFPERADVNGDGNVNSADALWILQHKTVSIEYTLELQTIINEIELHEKGDINGDGDITLDDAVLVLKYSVGIEDANIRYPEKCDITNDGNVNSADALAILKYLARETETEDSTTGVTENNHKIEIKMNDIPVMNLGGIVWAEKEKSGKNPTPSHVYGDGNEEEALGGITVRLKKGDTVVDIMETATEEGKTVTYLNNKGEEKTVSLSKGQYLFTNLEVGEDYTVEFDYDGIKYNALKNTDEGILYNTNKKSKISAEEDYGLEEGTKTVSGSGKQDESTTNGGFTIHYNLEEEPYQSAIYDKTIKDGEQVYVTAISAKYLQQKNHWLNSWKETSEAGVYEIDLGHYAFDVNCGLYEKYFDLNLGTDVDTATVSINGKTATYTYDQILDGKMDDDLNKTTYGQVTYNQYLSKSDYRYRIQDYNTSRNLNGTPTEADTDTDTVIDDIKGNELAITVNYRLLLNNQSTHTAYVNEVEYIYDDAYEYLGTNRTDITVEKVGNNKLKITQNGTSLELGDGAQQEIILTFAIRKNTDGTFVKDPENGEEYVNKAEIVSYSTDEGRLIDADSAPGNAFLSGYEERYEDDTDKAAGIKVVFKTEDRIISGTVFDDDDSDKPVNDVIVQLIEVKKLTNAHREEKLYEYIWQETLSGSNEVYTTNKNGWVNENAYTNGVESGSGNYEFKDFIPGKYIVRFIYGDGRVYDLTDNTLKYNGEDYKSTYNSSYDKEWYNTDNDLLTKDVSKAVDNEARRLKVMSYAVDVDASKGNNLEILDEPLHTNDIKLKDVLKNTWMAAETAKIDISVDTDKKEEVNDNTTVDVQHKEKPDFANTQFTNVNFGLMERPKTKLVLEKHITGLKITPVETGTNMAIADAQADIKNILKQNPGQITLTGEETTGLLAIKSTRNNRGYWYLQTDTTELSQGATANITYTYVIKNEGDTDYLSKTLVDKYKNAGTVSEYVDELTSLETVVKKDMKAIDSTAGELSYKTKFTKGTYLGKFYYNGVKDTQDEQVLATVEEVQEFLNPEVSAVDSEKFEKVATPTTKEIYNANGAKTNKNINEKVKTKDATNKLTIVTTTAGGLKEYNEYNTDWTKKLMVSKVLSASDIENGGVYDSYLADVTHYTNAAGRRDESTPNNLEYVHSEDTNMNMESYKAADGEMITEEKDYEFGSGDSTVTVYRHYDTSNGSTVIPESEITFKKGKLTYNGKIYNKLNENDEFWAETFRITKPTGEDKLTPVQIAVITISAVAVLGIGIILIKKFVLKK